MSAARARGTAFESAVVEFLRDHGFPYAERRAMRGTRDTGDVAGVIGWVLELKNVKVMELGNWCNEAQREANHDGGARWAVIHKRRGKNVDEAYVTMPLRVFASLLADDEGVAS